MEQLKRPEPAKAGRIVYLEPHERAVHIETQDEELEKVIRRAVMLAVRYVQKHYKPI